MRKGFTLIEVSIVLAITTILLSISLINLNSLQQNTYQDSDLEILVSDLKLQQLKSMSGATNEENEVIPFGIYFEESSYTLFQGTEYSISNPTNFTVEFDGPVILTNILFPQSVVIFENGSGEILNFTSGNNSITIQNTVTNRTNTITLNKYGVFTNVQ